MMDICNNKLLNSFPQSDLITKFKGCELVQLFFGEVLYESEEKIQYIYFPLDCVISLFKKDDEGKNTEVVSISNEGAAGTEICLNENLTTLSAVTTNSGMAYKIPKSSFLEGLKTIKKFRFKLLNYTYTFNIKITLKESENEFINFNNNIVNFCYASENNLTKNDSFKKSIKFIAA